MSALDKYGKIYIAVCFVVAAIYSFVMGGDYVFIAVDGFVFGLLICLSGYALWNFFSFGLPTDYSFKYKIITLSGTAVLTALFINGAETLAVFAIFPDSFNSFVSTLPVRIFITFLLFVIFRLYYSRAAHGRENIPDSVEPHAEITDRLSVRSGQKIKIIPVETILFVKADGDYISIHTAEGSWLKEQTMKQTEDMLPRETFIRIHRSFIVNLNQISRIERYGEKQLVALANGEKIKISAARYQILRRSLGF